MVSIGCNNRETKTMRTLLKKMKLIIPFRMELDISKKEFNNRLRTIMMEHTPGFFQDIEDSLQAEDIKYKGDFDDAGFSFVPKQNLFGNKRSAYIKGAYQENNGKLIIEGEVNGFSYVYLFIYSLSLLVYGSLVAFIIYVYRDDLTVCLAIATVFSAIYAIAFSIHMWLFRKSTNAVKHEVEKDLFYLLRDDLETK